MIIEADKDVASVVAFIQSFIEPKRAIQVCKAVADLAPVIWGDSPFVRFVSERTILDCDPPIQ